MTSREECEKAYLYLLKHCYEATKKNDTYDFAPSGFKESEVFKQLIEEHFELAENTEEYKHFKLHSASTLKNQTKEELIDYIKMLYHNWGVADDQLNRVIDKAKELSDSNDELRRQLYFIEPYKFEDLKPNMWVWDNVAKECLYVIKFFAAPFTGAKYFSYLGIYKNLEEIKKLDIKFEENRFFPMQCANYLGGI